ncbi:MAG TPA: SDR family oxidoreductase [Anaeromyxobacteraceae bacterium]|nr:SDR family oxidoreductase [Anaeromyxobacteraceae bacterium]
MAAARRVALVTGAGTRVGRALALDLARNGYRVVAHFRSHRPPRSLLAIRADLSTPEGPLGLARALRQRFDRLDLLVNSAALFERRPLEDTGAALFDAQLAVNARAPLLLVRALLPLLRRSRGSVVNVLDVGGALVPWSGYSAYGASKAALRAITEALAVELAPEVRVNAVAPGTVLWPESYTAKVRRRLASRIPLRRVGSPDDVARAIRFLADSPFVTGAVLPVDGGRHLARRE